MSTTQYLRCGGDPDCRDAGCSHGPDAIVARSIGGDLPAVNWDGAYPSSVEMEATRAFYAGQNPNGPPPEGAGVQTAGAVHLDNLRRADYLRQGKVAKPYRTDPPPAVEPTLLERLEKALYRRADRLLDAKVKSLRDSLIAQLGDSEDLRAFLAKQRPVLHAQAVDEVLTAFGAALDCVMPTLEPSR
jgi:hypothetical protein